jgi:probable O-glycosylation ligase (exosortase A-associated)
MRSLVLLSVFGAYLSLGLVAPFVFGLGYVWVDIFSPQRIGWSLINQIPVSLVMALGCIGTYAMADRRAPPRPAPQILLLLAFALWVTLTTTWAVVPEPAWVKWDWAIKVIVFGAFVPFLFRSRVQIEALLLTFALSIGATLMTFGVKTLLGGGGYGINLGLLSGNSGLAEGSTLAAASAATIPILLFLRRHGRILPEWWGRLFLTGLVFAAVMTTVGTHARSGLVCLALLAALYLMASRQKLVYLAALAALVGTVLLVAPERYFDRMSTISEYGSESSALGRIAVWLWTLEFAKSHPLGGGFDAYRVNSFQVPIEDKPGEFLTINGKAFHNMFFEVLGEHGYVGLALFAGFIACMFLALWRTGRRARRHPELAWLADLARSLQIAALVYIVGAQFVAVAFQPLLYYFVALSVSLSEYLRRVTRPAAEPRARSAGRLRRPAAATG